MTQKIYFAAYNYGYESSHDDSSVHLEMDVTGELTQWFYIYMAYSIKSRDAFIYVKLADREISANMDSL